VWSRSTSSYSLFPRHRRTFLQNEGLGLLVVRYIPAKGQNLLFDLNLGRGEADIKDGGWIQRERSLYSPALSSPLIVAMVERGGRGVLQRRISNYFELL
jgi:hypothetical protein